jgi:hypothetical protein
MAEIVDARSRSQDLDIIEFKSTIDTKQSCESLAIKNFNETNFIKVSSSEKRRLQKMNTAVSNTSNYMLSNKFSGGTKILENPLQRRDNFGVPIKKGGKEHRIAFKENLVETVEIVSIKEFQSKANAETVNKKKGSSCGCTCLII